MFLGLSCPNVGDNSHCLGELSDGILTYGDFGHLEELWDVFWPLNGKVARHQVGKFVVCLDFLEALA